MFWSSCVKNFFHLKGESLSWPLVIDLWEPSILYLIHLSLSFLLFCFVYVFVCLFFFFVIICSTAVKKKQHGNKIVLLIIILPGQYNTDWKWSEIGWLPVNIQNSLIRNSSAQEGRGVLVRVRLKAGGGDVIVIFRDQRPSWITSSEAYYFFAKQVKSSSILSSYIKTTQPHTQDFWVVVCPFFGLIFMLYYWCHFPNITSSKFNQCYLVLKN